jgi:hypothetical protein
MPEVMALELWYTACNTFGISGETESKIERGMET